MGLGLRLGLLERHLGGCWGRNQNCCHSFGILQTPVAQPSVGSLGARCAAGCRLGCVSPAYCLLYGIVGVQAVMQVGEHEMQAYRGCSIARKLLYPVFCCCRCFSSKHAAYSTLLLPGVIGTPTR
jgi:hypothetical protein